MYYFHRENMTRGKKIRFGIIAFEILILVLAIFFSRFEANSSDSAIQMLTNEIVNSTNTIEQNVYVAPDKENNLREVTFYVDTLNRVRIEDGDIVHQFGHLQGCPLDIVKFQDDYTRPISAAKTYTAISLATASRGVTVQTAKYEIVVLNSAIILQTVDNGMYDIRMYCE